MIEAKAPLYTHFTEAESTSSGGAGISASRGVGAGAVTIRAFGWEKFYQARTSKLVDRSQHPAYMQSCIQSWLIFVLNATVGVLAVVIVATVVTWREELDISTGGVGVSFIILIGLSQSLTALISSWTHLETRVGAVARVRQFITKTESESSLSFSASPKWPRTRGAVEFENVVASYRYKLLFLVTSPRSIPKVYTDQEPSRFLKAYLSLSRPVDTPPSMADQGAARRY